jgi:CheY-like chemotaxis protein
MTHHVLIADDHADIRRLLSVTLSKEYALLEAKDGASALDAVRRFNPRVLLLDIMMPGEIDGLQVLQAIKADPLTRDTLVVVITARGQASDSLRAKQLGADAYFVKPFSPSQVVTWIRNHLSP